MTAPSMTMVRRRLTVNFQRSVRGGKPQVLEVVVAPLSSPSAPNQDVTLVGGPQSQDVLLSNEVNSIFFDLVPTDHPDLADRLLYRIAWREKYMGRQVANDFVMPDFDISYDDLQDLGNIVGGETYVQWSDRSRANGVAGINEAGNVIDAFGNPVTGKPEADIVQDNLDNEIIARTRGDEFLRQYFLSFATQMVNQVTNSGAQALSTAVGNLDGKIAVEKQQRQTADSAIQADITGLTTGTTAAFEAVHDDIVAINTTLGAKADLVGGKVPSDQIPAMAVGHAVPVTSQAEMLALTPVQVQPGDIAVITGGTSQGNYILNAPDPSVLGNWVKLASGGEVQSVNGQTGAVNLGAFNVGARPAGVAIPQADITGLTVALANKTDIATTNALASQVAAMANDTTIVKTVGGVVPHAKHGNDVAFLDGQGRIVNKSGQLMNPGGEGEGTLDIADVTGLQAELNGKLDVTNPSVTNARIPTPHAASHQTGGTDQLTPFPVTDITGLPEVLIGNSLTPVSNFGSRISSLETALEGAASGGTPAKSVWFDNPAPIAPTTAMSAFISVMQKSPFGRNNNGELYYDPAGAAEGEWVYPTISPNGHLILRQRNETNPPDPVMATQAGLNATNAIVSTKADFTALESTNADVLTKASQVNLDLLSDKVDTKADSASLTALYDEVITKADQADLTALSNTVALKANQIALDATNAQVALKANQTALDATNADVATLHTSKANLVAGLVPLSEIPLLPTSRVTDLDLLLGGKADLDGARLVLLTQIPLLPQSRVTNLVTDLGKKADLVNGVVPANQLPSLAFSTTVPVASKAAMLALTPVQVQPGDICVITGGVDAGSYILNAIDPAVFANWVLLTTPGGAVSSVNGQTGVVSLNLNTLSVAGGSITEAQVTGLTTRLSTKADATATTAALATKAEKADIYGSQVAQNKQQATLVLTTALTNLSGNPNIDGVAAPSGSIVLVTKQASSVDNGLYVVGGPTDPWLRSNDMALNAYLVQGTLVTVKGGVTEHDTFWQNTRPSGTVGTDPNNWVKVMTAGTPPPLTGSTGVKAVKTTNAQGITTAIDFQSQVVSQGGIIATVDGLALDPNKAVRKFIYPIPASPSPTIKIQHDLHTLDVAASFRSAQTGDAVLVGWKPLDIDNISVEFDSVVTNNQYRAVILG